MFQFTPRRFLYTTSLLFLQIVICAASPSTGKLSTLVVRIIDSANKAPDISKDALYDTILSTSGNSVANQFRDCSQGKLDIIPYGGGKFTAVVDVEIDTRIEAGVTPRTVVAYEARDKIKELYDNYDLVQFCLPEGTISSKGDTGENWNAFAPMNSQFSYANDKMGKCGSISAWMHEIGHDMGLSHSGGDDWTDLMGASYSEQKTGFQKQCFNAAKNYQLGWYSNMQKKIDPLSFSGPSFSKTYEIVAVNDYEKNGDTNKIVVLEMEDFFIGYNAKKGITNADRKDADTIFIVQNQQNGESKKQAALAFGQSHTIKNYKPGRDVTIKFVSKSSKDAAIIEIIDDKKAPVDETQLRDCNPLESYELTVEIVGDNYPEDISWTIENLDTNKLFLSQDGYTNKKDYSNPDKRSFCLPYATAFRFTINDKNGDGICCKKYGDGYYRVYGPQGETLFFGGKYEGESRPYDSQDSTAFSTPLLTTALEEKAQEKITSEEIKFVRRRQLRR